MTKYALTCECGNTLSVEIGQAGEQVICQCGAKLDVPPLRKLRHLPVVTETIERQVVVLERSSGNYCHVPDSGCGAGTLGTLESLD